MRYKFSQRKRLAKERGRREKGVRQNLKNWSKQYRRGGGGLHKIGEG